MENDTQQGHAQSVPTDTQLQEGLSGHWLHPYFLRASFTLSLFTHNPKD